MRNRIIVSILRELYRQFLRQMIVDQVENTATERDDMIVSLLDLMLDYRPVEK